MKTINNPKTKYAFIFTLFILPTSLMAKGFTCSPRNDVCVVNDKSVVAGDELGFFTDRGELIATGKVTKMNGARRSVQLQQVMGQVDTQAESYAMLDGTSSALQKYRTYRRPAKLLIGSSFGLTTFGAGADSAGYEISGQAIRSRFLGQVDGYARGSIYTISGTSREVFGNNDVGEFKANALAATAGLSYNLFSRDDFVLRTEAGLGLAFMMASINGSASAAKSADWGYEVNSGLGFHARGLIAAGYKFDYIQLEAGFAPAVLAGRSTSTIGLGVLMNFD